MKSRCDRHDSQLTLDKMNASSNGKPQVCSIKLASQSQLARLKREEDEELWISGEELYTEGSSDEEDDHSRSRQFHVINNSRPNSSLFKHNLIARETRSRRSNRQLSPAPLTAELETKASNPTEESENKIKEMEIDKSKDSPKDDTTPFSLLPNSINDPENTLVSALVEMDDITLNSNENSNFNSTSEEEDTEISWKPKRVREPRSLIFEEAVIALRELQLDYHKVSKSVEQLRENLSPQRNCHDADLSSSNISNEHPKSFLNKSNFEAATYAKDIDVSSDIADKDVKMRNEILKIQELDISIQNLEKEIEEACAETLEYQLKNRKELKKLMLLRPTETGKLARNTEQFFKLYSKNTTPTDSNGKAVTQADITTMENTQKEDNVKYISESHGQKRQKLKKQLSDIKRKGITFIERNKQLAACSMGSLAITDEEKQRLKSLTADIDDTDTDTCMVTRDIKNKAVLNPNFIDEDTEKLLQELNDKLADINSEAYKLSREIEYGENEFLNYKMERVNHSLHALTVSNSKEIHPISVEEIQKLVNEYHTEVGTFASASVRTMAIDNLIMSPNISNTTSDTTVDTTAPSLNSVSTISNIQNVTRDIIDELIKEAKVTMPLFQFRHMTNTVENT